MGGDGYKDGAGTEKRKGMGKGIEKKARGAVD